MVEMKSCFLKIYRIHYELIAHVWTSLHQIRSNLREHSPFPFRFIISLDATLRRVFICCKHHDRYYYWSRYFIYPGDLSFNSFVFVFTFCVYCFAACWLYVCALFSGLFVIFSSLNLFILSVFYRLMRFFLISSFCLQTKIALRSDQYLV